MPRTVTQLRQGIGRNLGLRVFYGTANTAAVGGNTTTNLRAASTRASGPNGYFTGHWLRPTSGADSGVDFFVTSWTNTNGDFTVTPAASAATAFDAATFEVYPVRPNIFVDYINKAARRLFPDVARNVVDDSLMTGSPLWNPGFEDWTDANTVVGWTVSTSTLTRVTTVLTQRLTGTYSARLTGAAGYLGLSTAQRVDLSHLNSFGITVYALVLSNTASDARLRIVDSDGSTTGSYHTGDSTWQLLSAGPRTMRSTDPARPDAYDIRILKDSGASTSYIDKVWVEGGPQNGRYRLPGNFYRGPTSVQVASILDRQHFRHDGWRAVPFTTINHEDDTGGTEYTELSIPRQVPAGMAMRFQGRDLPTEVSADADNLEVDALAGELVEVEAAIAMLEAGVVTTPSMQQDAIDKHIGRLSRRRDQLMKRVRERAPALSPFGF